MIATVSATAKTHYIGRFAPTPSGPLHFGSMVAAAGSYLDAKAQGGMWALRIDDIDTPRVAPGAVDSILRCLERFQMHWDGPVVYQSTRLPAYEAAFEQLRASGLVYPCACSRKEIGDSVAGSLIYPGTCREGLAPGRSVRAWRVRTQASAIEFADLLQGRVRQDLAREIGDFVVWRADGIFAYHLACAVDDSAQGITHVVRGADLIASTPRQIFLQKKLALPTPEYLHLPVALDVSGEKLSKQTRARAVEEQTGEVLAQVLDFLGHKPPDEICAEDLSALWQWAITNWRRNRIPAVARAPAPHC